MPRIARPARSAGGKPLKTPDGIPARCGGGNECWQCEDPQPATMDVDFADVTLCPQPFFTYADGSTEGFENLVGGYPNGHHTVTQSVFDPCIYFVNYDHLADDVTRDSAGVLVSSFPVGGQVIVDVHGDGITPGTAGVAAYLNADVMFGSPDNGQVFGTLACGGAGMTVNNILAAGDCNGGAPGGLANGYDGTATVTY